jgi:predicted TIM-barrel fold metal-dependent hydrolase
MTVVDVDCHFEVALKPDEHPLRKFADRLPSTERFIADAIAGDLGRHTPAGARPPDAELGMFLPDENRSSAEQATTPGLLEPRFPSTTPEERIGWFDRIGIDHALMNPGGYGFMVDYMGPDRPEAVRLCNDFMCDRVSGHTDRMMPVSLADWDDLEAATAELEHARSRCSRAFWVRAEPFNAMSPAHPDWDRVWSAATELGMIAILHVGNTPARFDGGWGNAGWDLPNGTGLGGFFRFANSMRHQAAEMMLAGMVYGGVFGRHPTLTILTEELLVAWLPYFIARCEALDPAGPWPYDAKPSEMARRNIRATPLVGLGDHDAAPVLRQLPEMLVFSSDYPHGEGNADPITLCEPMLAGVDDGLRRSFLGDNIAECFARMGDPLSRTS